MNAPYRHQADDIYQPVPLPAAPTAQQYFKSSRKPREQTVVPIETGLEEVPEIEVRVTSPKEPTLLEPLERVLRKLQQLRALEPGWDSYTGKAVDRNAIRPALELVLRGIHKCAEPRIEASPSGAIELLWEKTTNVLEVEVRADGRYDCLLVTDGDEQEVESVNLEGAVGLLERFCRQ
jgi:hypothetical protein